MINLYELALSGNCHNDWLACGHLTIADIAVYPYIALAPEGQIDLEPFPAVIAWMRRIQALPGYIGMPGMSQVEQSSCSKHE